MTISSIISVVLYIILAPFAGALLAGIDRKVAAKMQGRQGPPLMQPLYDVIKLFNKETVVVSRMQKVYIISFFIFIVITGAMFFAGADLLIILFMLTTANIFFILAATCANSPYSYMGSQREILQMLSYEPMTLLAAVGFYMAKGSFQVDDIATSNSTLPICYLPGVFVGFVFILTIKLRKHPFDLSTSHHAHQEMVKGITTEMSGQLFGLIEISHWYENIFLLGMLALFFINGTVQSYIIAAVAVVICYFIEILVDNTNARLKWKSVLKSSWFMTLLFGAVNIVVLDILAKM